MLETELNDTEPNGEERSGARSPDIETAAGQASASSPPAESPPSGRADRGRPAAGGQRTPTVNQASLRRCCRDRHIRRRGRRPAPGSPGWAGRGR